MGGAVSLCFALDRPERVSRLVLIGAPVYLGNVPKMLWSMRRPIVGRILEPLLGRWTVRVVVPTAFHDRRFITEELIDEYSIALATREGRRAAAETLRRCLSPRLPEMIRRYAQLRPPVLFIRGEHDGVVDEASAEKFCRAVPKGTLLRIPASGHVPQEETPEAVIPAMAEFLSQKQQ